MTRERAEGSLPEADRISTGAQPAQQRAQRRQEPGPEPNFSTAIPATTTGAKPEPDTRRTSQTDRPETRT